MEFTRGDTFPFKFQRKDANGSPITTNPSAMYFTVKKNYSDREFLFQKTLNNMSLRSDNYWHCVIDPQDTELLPIGSYVYDIEVTSVSGIFTIAKGTLTLLAEATWSANK